MKKLIDLGNRNVIINYKIYYSFPQDVFNKYRSIKENKEATPEEKEFAKAIGEEVTQGTLNIDNLQIIENKGIDLNNLQNQCFLWESDINAIAGGISELRKDVSEIPMTLSDYYMDYRSNLPF
jgi:hypothetical protein